MIKKFTFTLVLALVVTVSWSQWTRVQQLPSSDIFTLYRKDNVLYAGGKGIIYFSRDKGLSWDSSSRILTLPTVDNIIIYKNELYASSYAVGIAKTTDAGQTWQWLSNGISPFVSDFCEFRGDLLAATLGSGVFKLDTITRNDWLDYNNGLSSLSVNINSILGNSRAVVAGTLANGLYGHLPAGSTLWEERFLQGQISATEGVIDIITAHDTLFLAGFTGKTFMSTDNGLSWRVVGDRLLGFNSSLVNATRALVLNRTVFDGVGFTSNFLYLPKDSLGEPFIPFSSVPDNYTYKAGFFGDKLWNASNTGLYFMSLSQLPGISDPADTLPAIILPVHFLSAQAACEGGTVQLNWTTSQEQNASHFNIERSADGIHWGIAATLPAAGNSAGVISYTFTDNNPGQNNIYRIAGIDLDGRVQYSGLLRVSCAFPDEFRVWPNPVRDQATIHIAASNPSQAILRVFDSKGALVSTRQALISPGNNQLAVDMRSMASGVYTLAVEWDRGRMKRTARLLKSGF